MLRGGAAAPGGTAEPEMPALFRRFDWAATELGPREHWPATLATIAELVLRAPTAMAVLWGASGVAIYNDTCRSLLGRRHPALFGAPIGPAWPDLAQLYADAAAAAQTGRSLSFPGRHFPSNGEGGCEEAWLDLDFCPIPDGPGAPGGILVVAVEQTQRVHAERNLTRLNDTLEARVAERTEALASAVDTLNGEIVERRAAEEALRQSQKMEAVGQLTGGIAHDFNNLLTGIIGSLDLMQRRLAQGRLEDLTRYATAAMTSANRAAGLTHRLLTFSRRRALDPKVTDVNRLVASIEDLLRRTISEKISLELDMPASVWRLQCDPNQLESAILNLVINARDAMPDGGRLSIQTGNASVDDDQARRWNMVPGQYVSVAVADTGMGMPPGVVDRVFEPFFTTKPLGVGTGLGLPMIYSFAQQSQGSVRIESEVGRGTTVTIYLPRCLDGADAAADEQAGAVAHPSGAGRVVLVVEDEQSVRSLVMEVLQDQGYRGMSAMDGAAALEILKSGAHVDLLITDVGLPGLDGPQLVEAALARRPDLKVLFMTAYARDAPVGVTAEGRPISLLLKPFTVDGLLDRVRQTFEARAQPN
jgi:signal transduction histidine kinase/ActR/RegA family two-component response regulator